jgi:hypothetical protein
MGFLEATVSLKGTIYKQHALVEAQRFLYEVIRAWEPTWLSKPSGPLSLYWNREDVESACFLISLADIFGHLQHNCTEKSGAVLADKLISLLRAKGREEFDETLLELQFARALSEKVSPIAFEPFVPQADLKGSAKPASPDYAVLLPEGGLLIEVTAFYFGTLRAWIRATTTLTARLRDLLEKRKTSRTIDIIFPLEFDSLSLLPDLRALADEICKTERGTKEILILGKKGVLTWGPMLIFDRETQTFREAQNGEIESTFGFAVGFQTHILNDDHNELFLKSLRKKLDEKRKETKSLPYFLTLNLRHHSIKAAGVLAALQERIWRNPKYSWLTGILIFAPAVGFSGSRQQPTLHYSFNPNAKVLPPQSFIQVLEKDRRFHYKDGIFYSKLRYGRFEKFRHKVLKFISKIMPRLSHWSVLEVLYFS